MTLRLPVLLALGALSTAAHSGIIINGNPESLRGTVARGALQVKGWTSMVKLTGRHGRSVAVRLPRPYALDEALPLPAGDWAELTLILDGPVTVALPGAPAQAVDLDTLTVPLDEPGAVEIHLDWTLPEGLLSALQAGVAPQGLAHALEDGALAVTAR